MTEPGVPTPAGQLGATDPPIGPNALTDVASLALHGEQSEAHAKLVRSRTQGQVPHPSRDERQRRGKLARATTPRQDLARWEAPADRSDPIALLMGQETSRVQELVPVRHARMATSPFALYRGSAIVMASDLARMPRTGLDAQLCGDAHLANFGMFAARQRPAGQGGSLVHAGGGSGVSIGHDRLRVSSRDRHLV